MGSFIPMIGTLLLAALGTSSYAVNERHGLKCVTYYHPVSRGLIFATKLMVAIPAILMVSVALALTVKETVPTVGIFVLGFLIYLLAVHACLMYQKGTVIVILAGLLGVACVIGTIVLWMVPTDKAFFFDGFTPVHDPYLVGLIPFSMVTLGSLITGYCLATNRRFLAGTDVYRQRYTLGCYLAVGLVTCGLVSVIQVFVVL